MTTTTATIGFALRLSEHRSAFKQLADTYICVSITDTGEYSIWETSTTNPDRILGTYTMQDIGSVAMRYGINGWNAI